MHNFAIHLYDLLFLLQFIDHVWLYQENRVKNQFDVSFDHNNVRYVMNIMTIHDLTIKARCLFQSFYAITSINEMHI